MADKRYKPLHSKIPVLSKNYKSVLRDVRLNKELIEKEQAQVSSLKKDLDALKDTHTETTTAPTSMFESSLHAERPVYSGKSELRTTITTPQGTKRKVRPSRIQFQGTLEEILHANIVEKEGHLLSVDELIQRLRTYDSLKGIGTRELLIEVSKLLGKTICYKGKQKRRYYDGVILTVRGSPKSVGKKASYTHPSTCKTQLSFEGVKTESVSVSTSNVDSIMEEFESMEILDESHSTIESTSATQLALVTFQDEPQNAEDATCLDELSRQNKELKKHINAVKNQFSEYVALSEKIIGQQSYIIELYHQIVTNGGALGGLLSLSERSEITNEIKKARGIFNLGIRNKDVKDLVPIFKPTLFNTLLEKLKSDCPTITCVLEQLVLSTKNAGRNTIKTPAMKMKAAIHLLSSLMDVRDQNSSNDVPILFGLLCMCFGAGPSMIELLQRLGLSELHQVLVKVLKRQLDHYKLLIKERVSATSPVITYQDNMQLMRTSLRHT